MLWETVRKGFDIGSKGVERKRAEFFGSALQNWFGCSEPCGKKEEAVFHATEELPYCTDVHEQCMAVQEEVKNCTCSLQKEWCRPLMNDTGKFTKLEYLYKYLNVQTLAGF